MTFTDNENNFIVNTVKATTSTPVDKLAYTEHFETIRNAFLGTHRMVPKNLFFAHLISLRKSKKWGPMLRMKPVRKCRTCKSATPKIEQLTEGGSFVTHPSTNSLGGP